MSENQASLESSRLAWLVPLNVRFWFSLVLAAAIIFVLAPVVSLTLSAFSRTSIQSYSTNGFTIAWFDLVLRDALYLRGAWNSFFIACAAGTISVALGATSALAIGRRHIRHSLVYLGFVGAPAIFPVLLTGMAAVGYFQLLGLQGTWLAIVIVHTCFTSPFALAIVLNGYTRPIKVLEAAARNLGASEPVILGTITIRQLAPSLCAAFALCFLLSWNEFVLAWFVSGLTPTLPTVIYGKFGAVIDPSVSAVGVLVIAISLVVMTIGCIMFRMPAPGRGQRHEGTT